MATSNKTGSMPYVKPVVSAVKIDNNNVKKLWKPGESFKYRGITYEVLESRRCKDCDLLIEGICQKPEKFNECCGYNRPDKTWIVFKKK